MDPIDDPFSENPIEGVYLRKLNQFVDERGAVLHMVHTDSPFFADIQEIYFSEVNAGAIKAWKQHRRMAQNLTVPVGRIRLVIYDDRDSSITRGTVEELIIGRPDRYYLIHIPPLVWYGFQAIATGPSLIVNCPDRTHDPDEVITLPLSSDKIPYAWPD